MILLDWAPLEGWVVTIWHTATLKLEESQRWVGQDTLGEAVLTKFTNTWWLGTIAMFVFFSLLILQVHSASLGPCSPLSPLRGAGRWSILDSPGGLLITVVVEGEPAKDTLALQAFCLQVTHSRCAHISRHKFLAWPLPNFKRMGSTINLTGRPEEYNWDTAEQRIDGHIRARVALF